MIAEKKWYVIYVPEHWEKRATEALAKKKIESYCPWNKIRTQKDDKDSFLTYRPLFTRLVFVRITEMQINAVKQTEGVLHFLYWLGIYAVISKEDIAAIRNFLNVNHDVWLEKVPFNDKNTLLLNSGSGFDANAYKAEEKIERLFLPTLGYFLLAETETAKKNLHHAI